MPWRLLPRWQARTRPISCMATAEWYAQTRCSSKEQLLKNPLYEGQRSSCYRSSGRSFRIILYFLDLREGCRLVGAYFSDKRVAFLRPEDNLSNSKALAEGLRKRFGLPVATFEYSDASIHYWDRPGGDPQMRDKISTEVASMRGANARMESSWAYDERLSSQAALTRLGNAASRSR